MAPEEDPEKASEAEPEPAPGAGSVPEQGTESTSDTLKKYLSDKGTELLDPLTAVRLVWAITGGFPQSSLLKEEKSAASSEPNTPKPEESPYVDTNAQDANKLLDSIIEKYKDSPDDKEKLYIYKAVIAMRAALRNLRTIHSGRELDFKENNILRTAYLDSLAENIKFGNDIGDYVKTLPTTIVTILTGLGISLAATEVLGISINAFHIVAIIVLSGILGYLLTWFLMNRSYKLQNRGLMLQEFERHVYFEQYVYRAREQLRILHQQLHEIREDVFSTDNANPDDLEAKNKVRKLAKKKAESEAEQLKCLLNALFPDYCERVTECLRKSFQPAIWGICDTGYKSPFPNIKASSAPFRGKTSSTLLGSEAPPASSRRCPYRPPTNTHYIAIFAVGIVALIAGVIIAPLLPAILAPPDSSVHLVKSPTFQAIQENQTVNVSVSLTNQGEDEITNILIEDEVPEGFTLIEGSRSQFFESLKRGETEYMNYTLRASRAGSFNISAAMAFYLDPDGAFKEITSDACLYKVPAISLLESKTKVSKSVIPSIAGINQTLVVQVTIENTGTTDISNIILEDTSTADFPVIKGETSKNISFMKPGEVRWIRYSINATEAGTFIFNPATAQFENQTVYSNSPKVQVVGEEDIV
jgi:uncharacterized repeat protein (TIGR01451 family)